MEKIANLKIDERIYPRQRIDWDHVQRLVDALQSGAQLPPVVICRTTRRIADGVHRTKAADRLRREEISCIEKDYADDNEFFLDSVRYNSTHGLTLTRDDHYRVMELGRTLKIDRARLSQALQMTVQAAGRLSVVAINDELRVARPTVIIPRVPIGEDSVGQPATVQKEIKPHGVKPEGRLPGRPTTHDAACDAMDRVIRFLEEVPFSMSDRTIVDRIAKLQELLGDFDLTTVPALT